jgi:hypothetical protein
MGLIIVARALLPAKKSAPGDDLWSYALILGAIVSHNLNPPNNFPVE